jgi:hypothetical protein
MADLMVNNVATLICHIRDLVGCTLWSCACMHVCTHTQSVCPRELIFNFLHAVKSVIATI